MCRRTHAQNIMRTPITVGVRTYATYAICRTLYVYACVYMRAHVYIRVCMCVCRWRRGAKKFWFQ